MEIFVCTDNISQVPTWVLDEEKYPQVSGITVRMPVINFLFGDKYNDSFMRQFLNDLKLIASYGKKIAIGIIFGKYFPVFKDCRYLYIKDIHHQNQFGGTDAPIRQPVFWDENYINRVNDFFYWFSNQLKNSEVYDAITQIKITGVNEKTEELKAGSDQDWRLKTDTAELAYFQSASVWDSVGYNISKVKMVIGGFIDLFYELFPDKIICLPVIGSKNGTPCINVNGICKPSEREDIAKYLIEYGVDMYPDQFAAQGSALMVEGGVPKKVSQSGAAAIIYQVERLLYNPDAPYPKTKLEQDAFQMVLENGRKNNATIVECFINSLRAFPNMHG